MKKDMDGDSSLSFNCFRDFVTGFTIDEIAKRHKIAASAAEERVRRGLYDFGFTAAALATMRVASDAADGVDAASPLRKGVRPKH